MSDSTLRGMLRGVDPTGPTWWDQIDDRAGKPIEQISLESRERLEQRYQREPEATHSDLVYRGYWLIAAQLRIDHAVGRI